MAYRANLELSDSVESKQKGVHGKEFKQKEKIVYTFTTTELIALLLKRKATSLSWTIVQLSGAEHRKTRN